MSFRGGVGHVGVGWGGVCHAGGGVCHAGVMVWQMYFKISLKLKQVLIAMI